MQPSVYLGHDRLLVQATWGGHLVVPTYNVDVIIGLVRDGLIEPWTTRLVQELVRPGHIVINGGANFGYYSVLAGHIIGEEGMVYAVDANPHILPYLLLSRHWAGLTNRMQIYHRALWDNDNLSLRFVFDPQYLGRCGAELSLGCNPKSFVAEEFEDILWSADTICNITDERGLVEPKRKMLIEFDVATTTIDCIVPPDQSVDFIHLDIEGAEAFALLGACEVIRRSPNLKLVTEWDGSIIEESDTLRTAYQRLWDFLTEERFHVRHLLPMVHEDGSISVSEPLARDHMLSSAAQHGDYIWLRDGQDPWQQPALANAEEAPISAQMVPGGKQEHRSPVIRSFGKTQQ